MAQLISSVIGHKKQLQQLADTIKSGRLPNSYLFVGPAGIGKKKVAEVVAQALLCEGPAGGVACGFCSSCIRVSKGQHERLLVVSPGGEGGKSSSQMIKIEQSREAIKFLSLRLESKQSRVVIIDEAEKLNPQAANALLKSIEEPPEGSYFILVANSSSSILPTIRSRSQAMRFSPLKPEELKQVIQVEDWVVASAQGSVELAEQISSEDFLKLILNQEYKVHYFRDISSSTKKLF